jgi:general secretion pathway protein C
MKLAVSPAIAAPFRLIPKRLPYVVVVVILLALLALQGARLIWSLVTPVGLVGNWKAVGSGNATDEALLTRFDPFFRDGVGAGGPAVVTNLALKLFGVRVNEASGLGSAIIATPDGLQSSYAVGDEIVPGVKLKAVTFDGVTIDRGGTAEQIYLDQSVAAPVAQASGTATPAVASSAPPSPLLTEIAFAPRLDNGQVTGFVVSPSGSGQMFKAVGLIAGDVLTAINGRGIKSLDDAKAALAASPPGATVALSVERAGKAMTLSARAPQ